MAKNEPTIWGIKPHTAAKHKILETYLTKWLPILGTGNRHIAYIDGFSGPGKYKGGEPGSPVVALNVIKKRKQLGYDVSVVLIEKNSKRFKILKEEIDKKFSPRPPNTKIHMYSMNYEEKMKAILDQAKQNNRKLVPTFAFLDPFGSTDISMELIKRLLAHDKCEAMITFMSGYWARFSTKDDKHIPKVFGCNGCLDKKYMKANEDNHGFILRTYMEKLKENGARYISSFEMIRKNRTVIYNLIFVTRHWRGLDEMKNAMLTADDSGTYSYSDRLGSGQQFIMSIKENSMWTEMAGNMIFAKFRGKSPTVSEIHEFVVKETEFPFNKAILRDMQKNRPELIVKVTRSTGEPAAKKQFANDSVVTFATASK